MYILTLACVDDHTLHLFDPHVHTDWQQAALNAVDIIMNDPETLSRTAAQQSAMRAELLNQIAMQTPGEPASVGFDTDSGYGDWQAQITRVTAEPLVLVRYGDYTYVTLGGKLLTGAYTQDCPADVLERLMRATHPEREVLVVDGTATIKQAWRAQHPGASDDDIKAEAELVTDLLRVNPTAFSALPALPALPAL